MSPDPRPAGRRLSRLLPALRAARRGDEGIGLILVLGYAVIISLVITVSLATVNTLSRSGTSHVQYGQAVDAAESGVDQTLARLQLNNAYSTAGAAVPPAWTAGFPDRRTERAWVLQTANTLLAASPGALQKTAQGEYFAMRPSNVKSVYSIGWEPSRAAAKRVRVLRNDYLFSNYQPGYAILARASIDFSGSFSLATTNPSEPPKVHSEGAVTCNASLYRPAGTEINGVGGANGNGNGACAGGGASATISSPDPRYVYTTRSTQYAAQWYDLCPDGLMHQPAASLTPCTGSAVTGSTRGWSFGTSNGTPTWSAAVPQPGIYYVFGGNANLDAQPNDIANVTVIAEAVNGTACPAQGGNISVRQLAILPAFPNVGLIAGGDASLSTQSSVGDETQPALVAARGKLDFNTSSANGVTGAVVAGNVCPGSGPNTFQGSQIRFVPGMGVPLPDIVRSTLQTELID